MKLRTKLTTKLLGNVIVLNSSSFVDWKISKCYFSVLEIKKIDNDLRLSEFHINLHKDLDEQAMIIGFCRETLVPKAISWKIKWI